MNIAEAIDHLWLFGANDHVSEEDGSYLHSPTGPNGCETCYALEEVRKLVESLNKPVRMRMLEDIEEAIGVPQTVALEPLTLPMDIEGETTLEAAWDVDELQLSVVRQAPGLELRVTGALELDGLIELRDKLINPAIEHHEARLRAVEAEAERQRVEYAARAEERAREEAERDRGQTFRVVSVARTVTPNMTVHVEGCSSLEFARNRQTLGTVIMGMTPDGLVAKVGDALSGRLNLRFCVRCKPVPDARQHNAHMDGGLPLDVPLKTLRERIEQSIWEAHHAALVKYDEQENNA